MNQRRCIRSVALSLPLLALLAGAADAAWYSHHNIVLNGAKERPANGSTATAVGIVGINTATNRVEVEVHYRGMDPTAAHIHGFAGPDSNAGVVFTIPVPSGDTTTTGVLKGEWVGPSEAQESLILKGRSYINLHSSAFPGGEIRGQIEPQANKTPGLPGWAAIGLGLLLAGSGAWAFTRRRAPA